MLEEKMTTPLFLKYSRKKLMKVKGKMMKFLNSTRINNKIKKFKISKMMKNCSNKVTQFSFTNQLLLLFNQALI